MPGCSLGGSLLSEEPREAATRCDTTTGLTVSTELNYTRTES